MAQAEEKWRATNKALSKRLKEKSYMILKNTEAIGFRARGGSRPIKTNKASTISKLRGCVTVQADPSIKGENKVLYFQFLDPNKAVISHAATTVTVNGNVYSKRIDFGYTGAENIVCDAVSVPEGSLIEGIYTLNVFEEEKLLSSTEFELK